MKQSSLQFGLDRFSDRTAGHLDPPSTQIMSRNTTRGIVMKRIPLTQGKFAIVDDGDYEWLSQFKWCIHRGRYTFYAKRSANRKILKMHRVIMRTPQGREVDHINHNGLDNRRANLRECSHAENLHNQLHRKTGTSKYRGVYWSKKAGKWRACIGCNNKRMSMGQYDSETEAAMAYNEKAKALFGEFAYLNTIIYRGTGIMICICGCASDEHEDGIGKCTQCDCKIFKASTGDKIEDDRRDWGGE